MSRKGWTRRSAIVVGAGAVAACARDIETPAYAARLGFNHGVASGDPLQDRVVIWTRVTPENAGPVPVRWIVARDRELTDVVKTGVVETNEARDYTVKVDVEDLRPGAPYFYGFRAGEAVSPIGKTRTLPAGGVAQLKFGVVSCASFSHGFFNAYEAMAQHDDIDVVLHLGDYIYEYGLSGYGSDTAISLGRVPSPEVELTRLEDYRLRHAQYKTESELQAAHAACPWIVVWDDHETANDSWSGGAENHQPNEGAWSARKAAALRAYYEWMPIREPEPGRAFEAINRSFQFGDLATLIMLETRLLARTKQLDYSTDLPIEQQRWDFSNRRAPVAIRADEPDRPGQRLLPAIYEDVSGELRPVLDWRRAEGLTRDAAHLPRGFFVAPDLVALRARLADPSRVMMGDAQEQWLRGELNRSVASQTTWQVIGNQVLMANANAPDLSHTPPLMTAALDLLRPGVSRLLKLTRFIFPASMDTWDGYPAERLRVYDAFRQSGGNPIVVTGDSHAAWANELSDAQGRVAVEFGTTSITSPSDATYFTRMHIDFAAGIRARSPDVKWNDQTNHGFLLLTLTKERGLAEFFAVSTIASKDYETTKVAAFTVAPNAGPGVGPVTAVT